jgi:hypothetical protein
MRRSGEGQAAMRPEPIVPRPRLTQVNDAGMVRRNIEIAA